MKLATANKLIAIKNVLKEDAKSRSENKGSILEYGELESILITIVDALLEEAGATGLDTLHSS